MIDKRLMAHILDSLKDPLAFTDLDHRIVYMNKSAKAYYERGASLIGTSLFDCHNEQSNKMIVEIFDEMRKGLEERLITDNEKHRIYMRAVRDGEGALVGYYERYEPPVKKAAT